jgi:hypothetical protein
VSTTEYLADRAPPTLDSITTWFMPHSVPLIARTAAMVALVAVVGITLWRTRARVPSATQARSSIDAMAGQALIYLAFTLTAAVASQAWGVPRYMAAIAPTVVILSVAAIDRWVDAVPRTTAIGIGMAGALLLCVVPISRSADLAQRMLVGRSGFQHGDWYTALRPAVREFHFDGHVLSNHAGFVWTIARVPERTISRAQWLAWLAEGPDQAGSRLRAAATAPTPLNKAASRKIYFVEVTRAAADEIFARDLESVFTLTPLVATADGTIWELADRVTAVAATTGDTPAPARPSP